MKSNLPKNCRIMNKYSETNHGRNYQTVPLEIVSLRGLFSLDSSNSIIDHHFGTTMYLARKFKLVSQCETTWQNIACHLYYSFTHFIFWFC